LREKVMVTDSLGIPPAVSGIMALAAIILGIINLIYIYRKSKNRNKK